MSPIKANLSKIIKQFLGILRQTHNCPLLKTNLSSSINISSNELWIKNTLKAATIEVFRFYPSESISMNVSKFPISIITIPHRSQFFNLKSMTLLHVRKIEFKLLQLQRHAQNIYLFPRNSHKFNLNDNFRFHLSIPFTVQLVNISTQYSWMFNQTRIVCNY